MKEAIVGTVKFVHPNGYGFVTTEEGDVFFHLHNFLKPVVTKTDGGPVIDLRKDSIEPKDIEKGVSVAVVVEEGPKGKAAKSWCFTQWLLRAEKEVEDMPRYRLLARRVVSGKPYGDPVNRRWSTDQWLSSEWVWEGYEYQLDSYHRETGVEYRVYVLVDKYDYLPCECPLGRYNGGPLFNLPLDWKQTV